MRSLPNGARHVPLCARHRTARAMHQSEARVGGKNERRRRVCAGVVSFQAEPRPSGHRACRASPHGADQFPGHRPALIKSDPSPITKNRDGGPIAPPRGGAETPRPSLHASSGARVTSKGQNSRRFVRSLTARAVQARSRHHSRGVAPASGRRPRSRSPNGADSQSCWQSGQGSPSCLGAAGLRHSMNSVWHDWSSSGKHAHVSTPPHGPQLGVGAVGYIHTQPTAPGSPAQVGLTSVSHIGTRGAGHAGSGHGAGGAQPRRRPPRAHRASAAWVRPQGAQQRFPASADRTARSAAGASRPPRRKAASRGTQEPLALRAVASAQPRVQAPDRPQSRPRSPRRRSQWRPPHRRPAAAARARSRLRLRRSPARGVEALRVPPHRRRAPNPGQRERRTGRRKAATMPQEIRG